MSKYEEAMKGLNTAQRKAVETIDGPMLVIAGPGTGKTQLLTTRIAHILATTDTLPQNILCLTFTDSAAQTMRDRLSGLIGQAAYDVTISTYHAFGSDILRRYLDYFADQAELQPVDDLGIDRIFREIINDLPYSNPLKYADNYLGDIKTLVSDAKRALLAPDDLRTIARHNLRYITAASKLATKVLSGMTRIDKKSAALFNQLLKQLPADDAAGLPANVRSLGTQAKTTLQEAVDAAEASGKTTSLTAWKNSWLAKDDGGQFVFDGTKANQKLLAAADVYDQYRLELQARGLFDYDDMILRAVDALQKHNDLRFSLQEQYLYILLDEFQDTNGAQLKLVELLTNNPASEGRPNVMAVGDDDQAIYAFQGADYSHMLQFKDMYRDVLAVPLTENYRSHADILHAARGIAEQIEQRLHHHFPAIEKTLTAKAQNLPAKAVVQRREAKSDVAQFGWVATQIKQLIKQGIPASDIAVLAPQHKYLEPLVPYLQDAGLPVRYEKRENVLDDPGVNQLLTMSQLVLALEQDDCAMANALWPQVLSFDFWELPTSTIWHLSWLANDQHTSWTEQLLADESLKPIALFFIRLGLLAGTETLETMLDYLIGSAALDLHEPGQGEFISPYYNYYFGDALQPGDLGAERADFWSLLTSLVVLRARLREYLREGDERLTLRDLLLFADAHREANLKILNTSPYASGGDAVQLMTAFKAKGMEFTAVFVLAVNDEAWGSKARTLGSRLSLPPNLQFIRYAGATNDERLRLFYVAITRAKSQLYLVNYSQNYAGRNLTRLKYLNETTEEDKVTSPLLPQGDQTVLPADDDLVAPTTELDAYWSQRHEQGLSASDLQSLLQDRLSHYQLSPTHLNDFIDVANGGPRDFYLRHVLRFPTTPRPEVQFGNAMHETLEWLHNTNRREGKLPAKAATLKTFEQCLKAKRLNAHDTKLFIERGKAALDQYLAQRGATFKVGDVAEHNFRNEGVFVGKAHIGGKIDKLVIDKDAKTITIVDYKTGKSHTRWSREVKLHKYRQQLYIYRALVEGSHSYSGYNVTEAYLEFVEPDEQGIVRRLHLVFDDTEYRRVKQLVQVVWQRITNLQLPDVSTYSADLSGIQVFENDLISS